MITPRRTVTAAEVGRHYDDLDDCYRDLWGEHVHHGYWQTGRESAAAAVEALIDTLADSAGFVAGDQIVDIGCGYGGTARRLASTRQLHVTGFTVSASQHREAVARSVGLQPAPIYHLRRWEENGLPDSSVDGAISIECFTHVPDKRLFFRELSRVLRPGGRAVMTVWMSEPSPKRWKVRHLLEPICREGRLASMGSADEYGQIIAGSGLEIVAAEDWSDSVKRTWTICARRLGQRLLTSKLYWRKLMDSRNQNAVFAVTLFRILLAYRLGAMRYGYFLLRKAAS